MRPGREMWDHDGVCSCGRKALLFGQCARCLKDEAAEWQADAVAGAAGADRATPEDQAEILVAVAGGRLLEHPQALGAEYGRNSRSVVFLHDKLLEQLAQDKVPSAWRSAEGLPRDVEVWTGWWKISECNLTTTACLGYTNRVKMVKTGSDLTVVTTPTMTWTTTTSR